jgi:glycosyltransferase involved in cell wall biosynthesis
MLMRTLERRLIRASDLTVAVTDDERRLLQAFVPGAAVRVVPTIHAVPVSPVPPLSARRKSLLFVGGCSHQPNVDAVDMFVRHVMPAVWRRDASITLDVAGSGTPPARLTGVDQRVRLLGWLEDLVPPLYDSLALVAPIRFGAGMKGKIGLALAHGLPVVTTEVGAEGFGLVHGETGLIAHTTDEIAAHCLQLAGDASLWARLSSNGQALVRRTLSPEAVAPLVAALLNELASALLH